MIFGSGTTGRIGLPAETKMSSASTSVTHSVARVRGGVAAYGGDATFLSGEFGSVVDSGRGEVMEECVCLVWMASLRKRVSESHSDKHHSGNVRRNKQK